MQCEYDMEHSLQIGSTEQILPSWRQLRHFGFLVDEVGGSGDGEILRLRLAEEMPVRFDGRTGEPGDGLYVKSLSVAESFANVESSVRRSELGASTVDCSR